MVRRLAGSVLASKQIEHGYCIRRSGMEMERLSKSCRQLIWLNPLLRYKKFEPRAEGVRIMLPYVDVFRSAHNINSLAELPALLNPSKAQAA
ncbi:MAG: hypothetical protein CMQ16_06255 [Gammaproteobacteria bacterium]|nr:hypothetical protein [Gammaproteobacteria bacterium]